MAKKKKNKKKNSRPLLITLLVISILLLCFLIWVANLLGWTDAPELVFDPQQTTAETQASEPQQITLPAEGWMPEQQTQTTIPLDDGLVVEGMGNYAGIYMEDGSDETVSNVMMLVVRNTSDQDLQLARIHVVYPDTTAQFEVSNLASGEVVVLLEKSRAAMPEGEYQTIELKNMVFFQEPMTLMEDKVEIIGGDGYIDVKNISDEAITGTLRVFYKNSAEDLLYGGITYVATVKDGIGAGETMRILTGHYSEGNSRVVNVTLGE